MTEFKKTQKLSVKIIIPMLVLGLISGGTVGIVSYFKSASFMRKIAFEQLTSIRKIKKNVIENYFSSTHNQMIVAAENVMTVSAMKAFTSAFYEVNIDSSYLSNNRQAINEYYEHNILPTLSKNKGHEVPIQMLELFNPMALAYQYHYLITNNNQVSATYDSVHTIYHPIFENYTKQLGFHDLLFVDIKGQIVYTTRKSIDFGTNISSGPYQHTQLKTVVDAALDLSKGETYLVDFEGYDPAEGSPVSFISSPIYDKDILLGVAVFQVTATQIDHIMTGNEQWKEEGLGETGETYLVGNDFHMRSTARLLVEDSSQYYQVLRGKKQDGVLPYIQATHTTILWQEVHNSSVEKALNGEQGYEVTEDYLGKEVLSAYAPLKVLGKNWAIVAQITTEEIYRPIAVLRWWILGITLLMILIGGIYSFFFTKGLVARIVSLTNVLKEVGKGNLNVQIKESAADEIGESLYSSKQMLTTLKDVLQTVEDVVSYVSVYSEGFTEVSRQVSDSTMSQAASLEEISSSMEEMASNIDQNTHHSKNTANLAREATEEITKGGERVLTTVDSMKEIVKKIAVINEIAQQTNLLSLNAAVEAARAGKHGRGFSVVAAEVRKLAERSQEAADEINQISEEGIQRVEFSNTQLQKAIPKVNNTADLVYEINVASKEQTIGAEQVNSAIQNLNSVVQTNANSAQNMANDALRLLDQAIKLKESIEFFKLKEKE